MGISKYFSLSKEHEPPLKPLQRMHLIVHPGDALTDDNVDAQRAVLEHMVSRARGIDTEGEAVVVLLQMNDKQWNNVCNPAYEGKERILRDTVGTLQKEYPGNVLIIPNAPSLSEPFLQGIFKQVGEKLRALKFAVNEQTELLSYGEMVEKCVLLASRGAKEHLKIQGKPTIDVRYTNAVSNKISWAQNGVRMSFAQTMNPDIDYIPVDAGTASSVTASA